VADQDVPLTVADALRAARGLGVERLDTHLILSHLLDRPRSWLLAHADDPLPPAVVSRLMPWLARRAAGEPLAYLLGEKEFHGLMLKVCPDVLVPRPDTETLVDWALERLRDPPSSRPASPQVLDLGTGSGAIALALKHAHPAAQLTASDTSPAALSVASGNALRLGLDVRFRLGTWWQAVAGQRFDIAVSNPPYIAGDDAHLPALRHEPRLALTPEGDGLAALRAIVEGAPSHLVPGGWLLLEHGHDQAGPVAALLRQQGFTSIATRPDLAGIPRCTGGHLGADAALPD
jgi:release factor glutamine methyltransferase